MTDNHPPIFVLRHGETEWNTELRLQGSRDSRLTERGRQQARAMGQALARALQDEFPAGCAPHLLVSPLGRTRETAELIGAALGVTQESWRADQRLAELSYGSWEGLMVREIEEISPGVMARWRASPLDFTPPGGESHLELRGRCQAFLDEAMGLQHPLIVVGHGVAGAMLRGLYLGLSPTEIFVLEKPQDALFRLHGGMSTKISAVLD